METGAREDSVRVWRKLMSKNDVRFGILLPHFGPHGGGRRLFESAELAEDLQFDSLWVRDNLFISSFIREHGGIRESGYFLDPLMTLAAISQRTSSIHLGTAVLIPHRHPLKAAHEIASLDDLSGGRVIAGIGLGADKNQFNSLGIPFDQRRPLVLETIEICRAVWSRTDVSWSGRHFRFRNVTLDPRPQNAIPFWHGGENWETVEFTATHCDGWLPSRVIYSRLEERISYIEKRLQELGKKEFTFGAIPLTAIGRSRSEALAHLNPALVLEEARRRSGVADLGLDDAGGFAIVGSPEDITAHVRRFLDLGVGHIVFDLRSSFETIEMSLRLLGEEVLPAFR